ncbi:MAG: hypothetical protein M1830_002329, partial [Pleopsidium flavum]
MKIDLNASLSSVSPDGLEEPVGREIVFSGKEEWVLRWLLKKLEAQGNDARLDPQAWLLMKKLVEQIPVVNVARLLSAHNFLQTLEKTLKDGLAQAQDIRQGQAASPTNDLKGPSDISDASGSSSTLIGTSTPGPTKQSRKRKRPAASMEEIMSTSPPSDNAHLIETLFCSLLGALSQLVEMSTKPSNGESVFAGQYMTAILRTDPNRTACILRSAFNAAEFLMRNDQLSGSAMSLTVASAVASFVTIWEYRSSALTEDLFGRASNEAFASHCLVPALVLLSSCREYQHKYSVLARTVTMLEQLLARHIVLPSRSDFLAAREQGASKASLDSILPSDNTPLALLEPLRSIDSELAPNNTPTAGNNLDMRVVSTIPLLFDVAVRCLPMDTQRKRIMEAPWLEAIFLNLTNQISLPIFSESAVFVSQQSLEIFEQMLQTAIDRNVSLETTILRSIVTRFSGILNIGKDSCRWTLIAKTLKLDANVFLIPTDVKPDPKGFSQPADKLLNTLFSQITTVGCTLLPTFSDDYKLIRSLIVLPLLREYAKARDLSGFLRHWHTELMAHEGSHSTSEDELPDAATSRHLSIWEDVDLINELRSLLESSLTAGQIIKALHSAMPDFEAFLDSGSGSLPGAYASLVVLDAILGAVQREETTDTVSGTVQSISQAITRLLSPSANWPKKHRWRLWHVATLINLQWPQAWSAHTQLHVEDTSTSGFPHIMWALNAIGGIVPSESGLDIVSWSFERYFDVVQAFHFILSCVFVKTRDNSVPSWFSEAVENIIMTIVPLLQYALTEAQREGRDPKFHWDGRPESVTSWDTLIVALATGLLRFPHFLKYATADSRFDLLQKLYRLAHWQDSVSEGNAKTLYMRPLVSVWEGLLEYEGILNNPIVLEDFLGIQVGALESESEPTTPSQGLDMFPDLAIRVLLNLPLAILRRHHREKILDSVLQRSLNLHTTSGFSSLTAHTSLMARLMEVPNASSILATDPAAIWDLARAFDQNCPGPDAEGLYAFEELVKLTLKHLISTKDQDRSRDYLKTFHTRLFDSLAEVGSTPANYGTQRLVKAALSMFWLHRDSLSKPLKEKEVKRLRRMYFDSLISDLMNFGESRRSDVPKPSRTTLLATLDSMTGYEDLLQSDKRRPAINSTFFDILTAMVPATDIADDTMPVESRTAYRVTSQVLTTIYTLVIYTQEKRGTSSMDLPLLLQLLRL